MGQTQTQTAESNQPEQKKYDPPSYKIGNELRQNLSKE